MATILTDIKQKFKGGSLLIQLIFINTGIFILVRLIGVLLTLFNLSETTFLHYLEMPSNLGMLLLRPWTPFTYMFLHFDFLHLLFNMLMLYWFGQIFLHFFSQKQLGALYILGGLSGAALFLLLFNLLPLYQPMASGSWLLGASASVLAVVIAASAYAPDYKINLLFIGAIPLKYLAIGVVLLDLLSITSTNAGGHIAHLGGALLGYWFARRWKQGKDITRPLNRLIDRIVTLFKPRPKMKVNYHRRHKDWEYNARKNNEMEEMDKILDKIKKSGYNSLTQEEKKKLFDAGNKS